MVRPLLAALSLTLLLAGPASALVFVQEEGFEEYGGVTDVIASPDGNFVYVTDYYRNTISCYWRSATTGTLEERFEIASGPSVTNMVISPDGNHLYAVGYYSGYVYTYQRSTFSGDLILVQTLDEHTLLQRAQGIAISADGASVYVTSNDTDSVVVFARDAGSGILSLVEAQTNGAGGVTALIDPIGIAVTPDGTGVYVACYGGGGNSLVAFARDPGTGRLTFAEAHVSSIMEDIRSAFAVAISPDSQQVYLSHAVGGSVYQRDPTTQKLTRIQYTSAPIDHDIWITSDGTRAYGCGGSGSIVGFARDPSTGMLTDDEYYSKSKGAFSPPGFCFGMMLTPDGKGIYTIDTYEKAAPIEDIYLFALGVFRRPNFACPATPRTDCRSATSGDATLVLARSSAARSKLKWTWQGGATALAELGDPTVDGTDYQLCLYEGGALAGHFLAPAASLCKGRPCWRAHGLSGFDYADGSLQSDGVKGLKLRPSAVRTKIAMSGKGDALRLPNRFYALPLVAQLQASDGMTSHCWEARYSIPNANSATLFRATAD